MIKCQPQESNKWGHQDGDHTKAWPHVSGPPWYQSRKRDVVVQVVWSWCWWEPLILNAEVNVVSDDWGCRVLFHDILCCYRIIFITSLTFSHFMAPAFSSFSVVSNVHNITYILRENKWAMLTKVLSSWRSHIADLQPPNLWLYNQTTPKTSKSSNQSSPQTSKPPNKSTHRPLSHPIRAPTHLQTTQSEWLTDSKPPNQTGCGWCFCSCVFFLTGI